ncbi:hypothetical protein Mapa_000279 [Marchantia paleacea]|nr:hypothetical protein Mapa_000279 [Marchantia paleacea]
MGEERERERDSSFSSGASQDGQPDEHTVGPSSRTAVSEEEDESEQTRMITSDPCFESRIY